GSSSGSRSSEPTVELAISGMTCASCARRVERSLAKVPGVTSAHVNLATERAAVSYDTSIATPAALIAAVERAGYGARELTPAQTPAARGGAATSESADDAETQRRQGELIRRRNTLLLANGQSLPAVAVSM